MADHEWKLNDDLETVSAKFGDQFEVVFSTPAVEEIIANLGIFRGGMKPPISWDWAMGQRLEAVPDPRWVTEPDALMGNSILHIRDPRYGWLHYMIPRDDARKLGQFLIAQADGPDPAPVSGKAN